jgi:Leucine-rich repeat (LRR) protein
LDISSSGITSLADVVGVASLKILRASDNGLAGLPEAALWSGVEDLRVGDNPLDTLAPLAGVLSLRRLDAPRTSIESVAAIAEIPGFGAESFLDVRETLLTEDDCAALGVLEGRGVDVRADVACGR